MIDDEMWRSLRDAVPSFAAVWRGTTDLAFYDTDLALANIAELARHLVGRMRTGDATEYAQFAVALETLYGTLPDEDAGALLTAGLMEDLIHEAEARDVELRALFEPLGPRSRDEWRKAYRYIHAGSSWV